MKKVAVFLQLPGANDYPLSKDDYRQAYKELGEEVEARGGDYYIVRGQETYLGGGKFSKSWKYQGDELVEAGEVIAEIIFDKGEFFSDGNVKVFNENLVNEICTNKWLTYNLFPEISPKSWLATNSATYQTALGAVSTKLAVVKPIDGQEGKDVFIEEKTALAERQVEFPVLVQEFLDSSGGVAGVVEGMHDLRIATMDGEIIYSYYRTPPEGSYLANVSRGGKFEVIDLAKIPHEVVTLVKRIDSVMSLAKHRFYGIDFAVTANGPKIIEMNSRLGLLPNRDHQVFVDLKKRLADIFCEA